jgi:hypothetical protein
MAIKTKLKDEMIKQNAKVQRPTEKDTKSDSRKEASWQATEETLN